MKYAASLILLAFLLAAGASSDFTGSENPLSEGGVWTVASSGAPSVKKVSGEAVASVQGGADNISVHTVTLANNQCSSIAVSDLTTATDNGLGPLVRVTPAGAVFDGYHFYIYNGMAYLIRYDDSVFVELTSAANSNSAPFVMTACMIGTSLTGYVNGVQILQATDATYASGRAGFSVYYGGAFMEGATAVESWSGYDSSRGLISNGALTGVLP